MGHLILKGDAEHIPLGDRAVNLTIGSPPYRKARLYLEDGRNLGIARDTDAWISWMLRVTTEALRVTDGPVIWVAAGSTEDRNYHPICEGLMYRWWQMGGHAYRPCIWHRVGIPGSGGDDWFRADTELAMCFRRPGKLPWSENTAMGHPPKFGPGGAMSNRLVNGERVRAFSAQTRRSPAGERDKSNVRRPIPELSNPGNLFSTGCAGGGNLGHPLAHESEAPFPEDLVEFFVRSLCPPGGRVLDPFSGSGTTVSVSERLGRTGIGMDLRMSQCRIARQRLERPHAPVVDARRLVAASTTNGAPHNAASAPLFAGLDD